MSSHVTQIYRQCAKSPYGLTDSRSISGDDLIYSAFKLHEWGEDHHLAGSTLMSMGLVRGRIVIESGKWWRLAEPGEFARGAWIMPVFQDDDIVELVAFAAGGDIGPWMLVGTIDQIGLERRAEKLVLFTQPYQWLRHWLRQCRENPNWLRAPETGPEAFAALIIDRDRIDWQPYRIEAKGALAGVESVHCADDPTLAEFVALRANVKPPKAVLITRRRQSKTAEVA